MNTDTAVLDAPRTTGPTLTGFQLAPRAEWSARSVLALCRAPWCQFGPQLFPLPDGGIQLEWHAGPSHVEMAFEADGTAGAIVEVNGELVEFAWTPGTEPVPQPVLAAIGRVGKELPHAV